MGTTANNTVLAAMQSGEFWRTVVSCIPPYLGIVVVILVAASAEGTVVAALVQLEAVGTERQVTHVLVDLGLLAAAAARTAHTRLPGEQAGGGQGSVVGTHVCRTNRQRRAGVSGGHTSAVRTGRRRAGVSGRHTRLSGEQAGGGQGSVVGTRVCRANRQRRAGVSGGHTRLPGEQAAEDRGQWWAHTRV